MENSSRENGSLKNSNLKNSSRENGSMGDEKKYLFDKPKNVKRLLYFLYGSCLLLFILDFVINRHISHNWEILWGFYPLYGFVGCVVLVLIATWMRTFLMRPENYYDDEEKTEPDKKPDAKIGEQNVDA